MRNTLTLDPDVVQLLREEEHRQRKAFKEVVNDAIRRGLASPGRAPSRRVRRWLAQPNVRFLVPGTRYLDTAFQLLEQLGTASDLATDVQLAAHAIEHGGEIHSNDVDFGRFDGLRWVNPLAR
jgi:predicted nucleic acid-binding protein